MASTDPFELARRGAAPSGEIALARLPRLGAALADDVDPGSLTPIVWQARFERRLGPDGEARTMLHLKAQATLPLTCVRCLEAVPTPVAFDRAFRLVADEALATRLDDEAEDHDVIAAAPRFSLDELVEDELLLALPALVHHQACAGVPPESIDALAGVVVRTADGDAASANPGESPADDSRQFPFADLARRTRRDPP